MTPPKPLVNITHAHVVFDKSAAQYITARRIIAESACWLWQLCVDKHGYGRAFWGKKVQYAHRVSYTAFKGEIPKGYDVDHICWQRDCVNPEHLRVLTKSQSSSRQRRSLRTHCVNGHEYTSENTYIKPTGGKDCRECITLRDQKRRDKKRREVT